MTKSLAYWNKIYNSTAPTETKGDEYLFRIKKDTSVLDEASSTQFQTHCKNEENAQSTLNTFFTYAQQGTFNTYGKLLQQHYFGSQYFKFLLPSDKPCEVAEMTAQAVVNKVASIINKKPIYDDGDLAKILQVIKEKNASIDLTEFNIVKRPSMFARFCRFFTSCSNPKVARDEPTPQPRK